MVIRTGRTLKLTAGGDFYTGRLICNNIRFLGKGLTAGDMLTVVDNNSSLVTEHQVINPIEDQTLIDSGLKIFINGIKVLAMPSGTCEVLVQLV